MSSLTSPAGRSAWVDASKNTIVVAILMPGGEVPVIDRMWNEEGSVRHLVARFPHRAALRACYEASPRPRRQAIHHGTPSLHSAR